MSDLVCRCDYAATPSGRGELARLIRDVFALDVSPLDRLGHDPSVVAFGWWHGDALVANVSLFDTTLWLDGCRIAALGVQSVAVRPEWRGRGLFRDLMTRALAHAETRSDRVVLYTATPSLYRLFGFRPVGETVFEGPIAATGAAANHRRLSLDDDADLALVRALFARRTPVSRVCAAVNHPALFLLATVECPEIALFHLPDLDAVVAVEEDETVLELLDVVAPEIPPLAAIAAALGTTAAFARVHVGPDRLDWRAARPVADETGLMVHGPWLAPGTPAILSPMHV